jgi:hypothetical protein
MIFFYTRVQEFYSHCRESTVSYYSYSYSSEVLRYVQFCTLQNAQDDVELGALIIMILILILLSNRIHSLLFADCGGMGYE